MKKWVIFPVVLALGGCSGPAINPAPTDSSALPVGRYQYIGKQVYADGTVEYTCLDTSTGEIGYASIPGDIKSAKLADFNCGK